MSEKFTYIDFLMYVIPDFFFFAVLFLSISLVFPSSNTYLNIDFLPGFIFLALSFIYGNFVQLHNYQGLEIRLKKEYCSGFYHSQVMYFPYDKIINDCAYRIIKKIMKKVEVRYG